MGWEEVGDVAIILATEAPGFSNELELLVGTDWQAGQEFDLKKNNLVLNRTLVDTVNMVLMVDKKGLISVESINISKKNLKYKEVINSSFNYTVSNLPKLYPAIKRGQQVDVIFTMPIIISTE